jgi:hypothetical protein
VLCIGAHALMHMQVFDFADKYRGSYSDSLSSVVCPFYCSHSYHVSYATCSTQPPIICS